MAGPAVTYLASLIKTSTVSEYGPEEGHSAKEGTGVAPILFSTPYNINIRIRKVAFM